ncbi:S49 family peptidase [Marinomonas ostreistagni]|uniref:S49 family peptidase n=1 Tax=Marinomonas ostreistagni TaxID=359209 RepID=A0ABS0ZAR7_9GAMM|nr:S49 family peptidase [Marinomonas ostreistagni]MBJ7550750.1 S49 family peptidase [Marinomonas ostreistagni]
MSANLKHIASRALDKPLLLDPGYARTFFSALSTRLGVTQLVDAQGEVMTGEKMHIEASSFMNSRDRQRPYQVIEGVALVPVSGTLVHKFGHVQPYSGMTGYDGVIARVQAAIDDSEVKGILLDMDTPGGEVAGCFDAAQTIRVLAQDSGKPLWAVADDMACSAGMAIASAADRRLITQSAVMGSVGVVMAHQSYEGLLKENGVKVTLIHSGAHKVDGNPYEDLSAEVLAAFQEKSDSLRQEFAALVSTHTGLSVEAVLATEAKTYRGQEAIDVGFADQLVNGNEAIAIFADFLNQPKTNISGVTMSAEKVTDNAVPTVPAAQPSADAPQMSEKDRIKGIMKCEAAAGREKLAEHFAYDTDMSVEAAQAALAMAPQAQAPDATSQQAHAEKLDQLMKQEGNPNITDDVDESASADDGVSKLTAAYAYTTAT